MRNILLLAIMKAPRIHQRVAINPLQVVVAILTLAFAQQSAVVATLQIHASCSLSFAISLCTYWWALKNSFSSTLK